MSHDPDGTWDYIIVGAGSGGSVAAARLADAPGIRVLLLEAGGADVSPFLKIPAGILHVIRNPKFDWCYPVEADPSVQNREMTWSAGRSLGGGSSINGMVFIRGLTTDFAGWRNLGAEGWDWPDVLPYFRRLETWLGDPGEAHGQMGPLKVAPPSYLHPLAERVLEAARQAQFPTVEDLNDGVAEGFGYTPVNIARGLRDSAASAFLRRLRAKGTLRVLTNALAERLTFEGRRCTGVRYRIRGGVKFAKARREVIVCAGAIGSPALLMRSGVGPPRMLQQAGIEIVAPNEAIGKNLQEHAAISVVYSVNTPTIKATFSGRDVWDAGWEWALRRGGPATMSPINVSGFIKSDFGSAAADVQIQFSPITFGPL